MKVVGLDISQTATGVVVHEPGGVTYSATEGEKAKPRKKTDPPVPLAMRHARMKRTTAKVAEHCRHADLVAVEAHSFTVAGSKGQHDLSGQWWDIVDELYGMGIVVVEITVQQLKGYLTGNGSASKDLMLTTAVRRYPTVNIKSHDEADAMAACSMAVRHLELAPLETVWNLRMEQEMDKVQWPS